jgi:tRNA(Ile)-lysidine synthase
MVSSRKLKFLIDRSVDRISSELFQAVSVKLSGFLDALSLTEVVDVNSSKPLVRIAVAYSAGLDSSVLLSLVAQYCRLNNLPIYAFHVHHGISLNADAWEEHARQNCRDLQVTFDSARVQLHKNGLGVEAAARSARYSALGEMCSFHGINLLLTAHHQDDQAETILLQLMRGTGLAGLSGMDNANYAPDLLGGGCAALIARPLLGTPKKELQRYALTHAINFVDDESNHQTIYTRNALRLKLMPLMDELAPGYSMRLARASEHARSALNILTEVASEDCARCSQDQELLLVELKKLSSDRVDNLLRFWMRKLGMKMPSTVRFNQIKYQIFSAKEDARIMVRHENWEIHRYRNKLSAARRVIEPSPSDLKQMICWKGEEFLTIPTFKGCLYFTPSKEGVAIDDLLNCELSIRGRQEGERLRLALNRPSRDMKSHFQTAGIPYWRRSLLPFVYKDSQLLFVAELGLDSAFISLDSSVAKIQLRWQADE